LGAPAKFVDSWEPEASGAVAPGFVDGPLEGATGITNYLENGGAVEKAMQIAAHESPRTTKLYDRSSDQLSLDEIERIAL
jgi:hypothetical protein